MILKEFCLASFLVNEINLKHLSPGFKSIHVGLWAQGLFAWGPGGGFVCNASKRDSFPTSLTLSWGQSPTRTPLLRHTPPYSKAEDLPASPSAAHHGALFSCKTSTFHRTKGAACLKQALSFLQKL